MPRRNDASPGSTAWPSKESCALTGCGTETSSQSASSYAGSVTATPPFSMEASACFSGIVSFAHEKRQSAFMLNVSAFAAMLLTAEARRARAAAAKVPVACMAAIVSHFPRPHPTQVGRYPQATVLSPTAASLTGEAAVPAAALAFRKGLSPHEFPTHNSLTLPTR